MLSSVEHEKSFITLRPAEDTEHMLSHGSNNTIKLNNQLLFLSKMIVKLERTLKLLHLYYKARTKHNNMRATTHNESTTTELLFYETIFKHVRLQAFSP